MGSSGAAPRGARGRPGPAARTGAPARARTRLAAPSRPRQSESATSIRRAAAGSWRSRASLASTMAAAREEGIRGVLRGPVPPELQQPLAGGGIAPPGPPDVELLGVHERGIRRSAAEPEGAEQRPRPGLASGPASPAYRSTSPPRRGRPEVPEVLARGRWAICDPLRLGRGESMRGVEQSIAMGGRDAVQRPEEQDPLRHRPARSRAPPGTRGSPPSSRVAWSRFHRATGTPSPAESSAISRRVQSRWAAVSPAT